MQKTLSSNGHVHVSMAPANFSHLCAWCSGRQNGKQEKDFVEGSCLISKVVFLPSFHKEDPARKEAIELFEYGDGRLEFQDFAQAILTTGTFLTLAILNTAYVACLFPAYDTFKVVEMSESPSQCLFCLSGGVDEHAC